MTDFIVSFLEPGARRSNSIARHNPSLYDVGDFRKVRTCPHWEVELELVSLIAND